MLALGYFVTPRKAFGAGAASSSVDPHFEHEYDFCLSIGKIIRQITKEWKGAIFIGEYHGTSVNRPVDIEVRVVPYDPSIMIGAIVGSYFV